MFISNLGCPERRGNHSLTSKRIFENLNIQFKTCACRVILPLIPGGFRQEIIK